jgi:hypothetical protein
VIGVFTKSIVLICPAALYFQEVQGDSAVRAGIKSMPFPIAIVISSMGNSVLVTLLKSFNLVILVETTLLTAGAGCITTFWDDTPLSNWFRYQIFMGRRTCFCFLAPTVVVQNVLPRELIPQATACVQIFLSLG